MSIAVCVKQVPLASEVSFDLERKTVVRDGVPLTLNAYDRRALTEALRLKERLGGEVIALTMGPPQAREALVECLSLGCERAVHICDPALAGSDSLVTARVLAAALRSVADDLRLVFCGKHSVDAETGQVGPELAELLGLPQVTGATAITFSDDSRLLRVERETDQGREVLDVPLPALLTAAERLCKPLKTDPQALEAAAERPILTLSSAELGLEPSEIGVAGSPTLVSEIRTLEVSRERRLIEGEPELAAQRLAEMLDERGLLAGRGLAKTSPFPRGWSPKLGGPGVWVVADVLEDKLRPATLELMGKGAELAARLDGELAAVLIGGPNVRRQLACLIANGGPARVYLSTNECLASYQVEPYAGLLADLIRYHQPRMVLFSATSVGRDLAPRVAARLGLGLTADCVGLELNEEHQLVQLKPAFGGMVVASILSRTRPEMATVRPGILPRPGPLELDLLSCELCLVNTDGLQSSPIRLIEVIPEAGTAAVALEDAPVVVGVGTGIGGPEHLPVVEALAQALGGAIGATRKVVDLGWLPRQQQIGLTGQAIAPSLYVGVGVRGAFNHAIGIMRAGTTVAINNDPQAEIFQLADLGIVGDWERAVPVLTEAVLRRRAAHDPMPGQS